jgi:hypothetical protein
MISDSDLERIGRRIEAEFEGVKAHYRRESDHGFVRGIGLEIEGRRHGFIVGDDQDETSLISAMRSWLKLQKVEKRRFE